MEHDSPRPLLESTGWLAAHRRIQQCMKLKPVHEQRTSISGQNAPDRPARCTLEWHSWGLQLFNRTSMTTSETPRVNES